MSPVLRRAAAAALAAALSLHGSAAELTEGTCAAGSAAGTCEPLHRETALLQVESARLAAARDGAIMQVQDAGVCCFFPISGGCSGCQSGAAPGSYCAGGEGDCSACGGTWCPGAGAPSTPATAPAPGPTPSPAAAEDAPTPAPATAEPATTQAPALPSAPNLLWADEFDGSSVDRSKWGFEIGGGGFGNQELEYYTDRSDNAQVQGGTLKIVAKCEQFRGSSFTSAKLKSAAAWGPGIKVEVRARLPTGKGSWPAIWMLPQTNTYGPWPKSGEIDIMESVGCEHSTVHGTVHTGMYNHVLGTQKTMSVGAEVSGWRTYAVEWEARQIRWYVDGALYFTFAPDSYESAKWPFDQKFYLILNVAVGGSWGGYCTPGGPSCKDAGQFGTAQVMEVDYVRITALR